MKKLIPLCLCGLVLVSGCARHYVMRLSNGNQIVTSSKPKAKGAVYTYKDAKGQERAVPRGRVSSIEPASISREETSSPRIKIQHTKQRHWYTLWLFKT